MKLNWMSNITVHDYIIINLPYDRTHEQLCQMDSTKIFNWMSYVIAMLQEQAHSKENFSS